MHLVPNMNGWRSISAALVLALGAGCEASPPAGAAALTDDVLGKPPACSEALPCAEGSTCVTGQCVLSTCESFEGDLDTLIQPPRRIVAAKDVEIARVSANVLTTSQATGDDAIQGWTAETSDAIAIAGGRLLGRTASLVIARRYAADISLIPENETFSLPIWPIALAAGQLDDDILDELFAINSDGDAVICHLDELRCDAIQSLGTPTIAATLADTDGDGMDEIAIEFERELGVRSVELFTDNLESIPGISHAVSESSSFGLVDFDRTGEQLAWTTPEDIWDYAQLHIRPLLGDASPIQTLELPENAVALAGGDLDGDGAGELIVELESGASATVRLSPNGSLTLGALSPASPVARAIALVDVDLNSQSAELVSGPEMLQGPPIPMVLAFFPPYSAEYSDGVSSMSLGSGETESTAKSSSFSIGSTAAVGFSAGLGEWFKASVSSKLGQAFSKTITQGASRYVGRRFDGSADAEQHGQSYGIVQVATPCFARYRFAVASENNAAAEAESAEVLIPLGAAETVLTTARYEPLARSLGMPSLPVASKLGSLTSYPTSLVDLYGEPVAPEHLVIQGTAIQASDAGQTGASLSMSESTSQSESATTSISLTGSGQVAFATLTVEGQSSATASVELNVASNAHFGATIPALVDDTTTPEDEFTENRYGFTSYVFKQPYVDTSGNEAAIYVMNHFVSIP